MKKPYSLIILACLMLSSCNDNSGMIHIDPSSVPKTEETEKQYDRIFSDELVPEDFSPEDYIYLQMPLGKGDSTLMRVNPYSARVTRLCSDPLCTHEQIAECPEYYINLRQSAVNYSDGALYYSGGKEGITSVYDYELERMVDVEVCIGKGLVKLDIQSGNKTMLLEPEDRYDSFWHINEAVLYENYLYYCDDAENDSREDSTERRTNLFRVDLNTDKIEDLGEFLGRVRLVAADGLIWNFEGNINGQNNPLWEDEGSYCIVTDLENKNPQKIPVYTTPVDDADGYIMATSDRTYFHSGSFYLLYVGEEYERHVFLFNEFILGYKDGIIYYSDVSDQLYIRAYDIITCETETVIDKVPTPDDAEYVRINMIYKNKFAIYEVLDDPSKYNSVGELLYYMRIDMDSGEIAYIYPPEM